ncbi:uncharacterized protein TNCV_4258571 [Trichonephila clavipes]|nr:uncharacterized protein TNCV_4258571 [Trichonephila clavipes]
MDGNQYVALYVSSQGRHMWFPHFRYRQCAMDVLLFGCMGKDIQRGSNRIIKVCHVEAKACKLHCRLQVKSYREGYRSRKSGSCKVFNIDESNIRLWREKKNNFENCDQCKRADCDGKPHWPKLEEEINKWILKEKDNGKAVFTLWKVEDDDVEAEGIEEDIFGFGLYPVTADLNPYTRNKLHPGVPPPTTNSTREALCRSTDIGQAQCLPGIHPGYSTTASGLAAYQCRSAACLALSSRGLSTTLLASPARDTNWAGVRTIAGKGMRRKSCVRRR